MVKLKYPGLNLFSYTLKQGLGVSEEQVCKTYKDYLGGLTAYLQESLKAGLTEEKKREFQEMEQKPSADLDFSGSLHSHKLEGLYRRRSFQYLHDSYFLLFNGYVDKTYEKKKILDFVADLKALLREKPVVVPKTFGETWLISGVLVSGSDAEAEALVEEAWQKIFGLFSI